ncbi:MAG: phosphoribulokinase [Candidatus Rokuibacteriota bacterium]|nr:MAG: phosphoribulokinase [Candidatus Rokubacteria bacterium]
MTVEEVMTREVVTVGPETTIQRAARLMVQHGVSGLPVVEHGQLVGFISDGDLILRQRRRDPQPWWHRFFENGAQLAREYEKAVGTTVGEVMTRPVVTISSVFGIATAAAIMTNRNIRRLPVVRDGQLVGIVTRGDLIRALADESASSPEAAPPPQASS